MNMSQLPMPLLYTSLFNRRFLNQRTSAQVTSPDHKKLLTDWAETIRNGTLRKQKETEARGPFIQRFFVEILGYQPFGSGPSWTINDEKRTGGGSADTALGHFNAAGKSVIAPVELKGADTPDLDAIMPGRHKSPVQQVWEYAMDTPGCQFLLVSNMLEFRLYAVGHTRQVYERFDILELADSDTAYQRFRLLLSAERLLGGDTAKLLAESALVEKAITEKLYSDYKTWRIGLLLALIQHNELDAGALIEPAQKLLDRVLFVAFAEDRGLLPPKSLAQAWRHRDHYNPRPVWQNFQGLFRSIDKGNPQLGIPAYNGGLFATDPVLDALVVPDDACRMFSALGEYDFADDVSVTVLGHIFEQSVSDLEQLIELADSEGFTLSALEAHSKSTSYSTSGKRKQDGIVYTPDAITRFIVDETLGSYLANRLAALRVVYSGTDGNWRKPSKAEERLVGVKTKLKEKTRLVEFLFWHAWREELRQIRVLDPACGSGAFLVAAFDLLDDEYHRVNEQIQAITGNPDLFDINREILNGNLYGVDLNPESIEISKLSLWLKTAQYGKPLESLEANLRVGNSLIDDSAYTPRPFDWQAAFPDVFADGGFDVVLGNPPYVRMERLKAIKPFLEKHYAVASDRADLYGYFYELGLRLLKPGGRLGYISSSTFFKTGSGQPLRRHLISHAHIRTLVDFGDIQIFEGVTTYPAIVVMDKRVSSELGRDNAIRFLALGDGMPVSLASEFSQHAGTISQRQLGADAWQLASDALVRLRAKLTHGHPTLKECYGAPLYGIKTGLERAFVVDRATRDRLVNEDPNSSNLLKPYLEGKDIKTWHVTSQDLWVIYTPKRGINIASYPAIGRHLLPFRDALEGRATKQEWFELQQSQERYSAAFARAKIIFPDITDHPRFALDTGAFLATTCFCVATGDLWLLSLLNSRAIWWLIQQTTPFVRGGFHRLKTQYVEQLPIPAVDTSVRTHLAALAESAQRAAVARRDLQANFRRRVLTDLAPGGSTSKLTAKLAEWPALDFKAFHDEVKKQFKSPIPLAERDDWQSRFETDREQVAALSAEITRCEREIDAVVYALFGLNAAEIALIEK